MDTPFIYDRYVTGKNFIGRKAECGIVRNLLGRNADICMYGPPKSGKMSVIQQAVFDMRMSGQQFMTVVVSLYNVRTLEAFLTKFGTAVIRPLASTPAEYEEIVDSWLAGTHFVFDPDRFSSKDEIVSLNWEPDDNDILQMMRLPSAAAAGKGMPLYVILEEFQNIMMVGETGYEKVFRALCEAVSEKQASNPSSAATYILVGSKVNAMKFIFEERKYFYRLVEHVPLGNVDSREIVEHVIRGFLVEGKVVERDLVLGAAALFKCNLWYINHFTAICDSMSKGYINEGILMDALNALISVHRPRFMSMADDLTDHQMNMMRAILDGVKKFSSADVIEKYGFNSSANVRRIKDALKKKEIITFDEKDEPVILDPLFEYWLTKYYFER